MGKPIENPIAKDVLNELYTTQNYLPQELHPSIRLSPSKYTIYSNTFSLTVGSPLRVLTILNELYKDATVYLDRKYVLYIEKRNALTQSSLPEMVGV